MNPILNPFTPGAGSPPPELAGRDDVLEKTRIAIERSKRMLATKGLILIGLRGVGKTVLLDTIRKRAEQTGLVTVHLEAPENRSLPSLLAPALKKALLRISRIDSGRELAQRGLRALASFVRGLKVKFNDLEVTLDVEAEAGLADDGILENDLQSLLAAVGEAVKAASTALLIVIDELQYVPEVQLEALINALHANAQQGHPILLIAAGLPQLRGQMGEAKSYAERLFDFTEIGPLDPTAATNAIRKPLEQNNVSISHGALAKIISLTSGYPYFLQEWGKNVWNVAPYPQINEGDVDTATAETIADLDESFFRVRFDRLTSSERQYVRAMAELGPGPHRTSQIADVLGKKANQLGMVRSKLIAKGMVWSPGHGDTAFTVPLFDEFMRRIMPGQAWRSGQIEE